MAKHSNQLQAKELLAVKKEAMDLRNRCEQQRKELLEKESETVLRMQQQRQYLTDMFKQREKDLEEKLHRHYKNKDLATETEFETRLQKKLAGQREELQRQHSRQMEYAKKLMADLKEAGWCLGIIPFLQKEHDVQVNSTYKKTMEAWWVSTHCVFPCHSNCQQAAQAEQAAALASATKASACTIQIKTYLQLFLWRLYMMPRRRPRRRRRSEKNNFKRKSWRKKGRRQALSHPCLFLQLLPQKPLAKHLGGWEAANARTGGSLARGWFNTKFAKSVCKAHLCVGCHWKVLEHERKAAKRAAE